MQGTAEPTDDEREAVAEIGKRSGRGAPADTATLIEPDILILGKFRAIVALYSW